MKKRSSNFELMRIVAMFFIVIWHSLIHGNVIANCQIAPLKIILTIVEYCIIIHVNSFILLMGYYQSQSKMKLSKVFNLLGCVITYSVVVLIFSIKMHWLETYSIVNFINNILPHALGNYWFIAYYVTIYLLSDYLNILINHLTKKQYHALLILGFFGLYIVEYLSGYYILNLNLDNFLNFLYLYFIGAYLHKYPLKDSYHFKNFSCNSYRLIMLILFFGMAISNYLLNNFANQVNGISNVFTEIAYRLNASYLQYINPFVLIQSLAFFELFKSMNFKNTIINYVASCTFGIYLAHDNPLFRHHIYKLLHIDIGHYVSYKVFSKILLMVVVLFIVGIIIESIRKFIVWLLYKIKLLPKINHTIENFLKSVNCPLNW